MRPIRIVRTAGMVAFVAAVGCGGEGESHTPPTATVRDSAGIRIVESAWSEAPVPGWSLSSEPLLSIGTFSGEAAYEFSNVRGARRLPDGRIALADAGSREVRLFDASGDHLRSFGRQGGGPGEFEDLSLAGLLPGDTLVVVDSNLRRISLVHAESGFSRSLAVDEAMGGFALEVGLLADSAVVFGGGMFFSSADGGLPDGEVRAASDYGSVNLDGSPGMSLGRIPTAEMFASIRDGGFSARLIPFGRLTASATGRGRVFVGTNDSWEIAAYDPTGTLAELIRTDRPAREVTSAMVDALVDEQVADAEDENQARTIRSSYLDMPAAETVPPYSFVGADALGYLWVRGYDVPGEAPPSWAIFDPEGRLVGQFRLPEGLEPLEIGDDYVLGKEEDELEVETVVLYRLERGG